MSRRSAAVSARSPSCARPRRHAARVPPARRQRATRRTPRRSGWCESVPTSAASPAARWRDGVAVFGVLDCGGEERGEGQPAEALMEIAPGGGRSRHGDGRPMVERHRVVALSSQRLRSQRGGRAAGPVHRAAACHPRRAPECRRRCYWRPVRRQSARCLPPAPRPRHCRPAGGSPGQPARLAAGWWRPRHAARRLAGACQDAPARRGERS